ncbi:hypothetical protein [Trichlorobacter ammonificans]|uniref:Motility protein n=1 Tax=Trichlorobacter ammonificans TaxID=2916410 RepID=A0ABM9DAA1_9BACT|nr:hypothetical protein [Trichlorobacter ammonificans]CAH2032123.1 conserved protein of unknown function [Trichlorobacter ammonificans]
MDVNAVAGASLLMKSAQTQQNLSAYMIKMNAQAQEQMANLLARTAQQTPQPAKNPDYGFSTYA